MRKIFIGLVLACISFISYSQPKTLLRSIADKLDSYQDYQSYCYYTFSFPFGDPMSIESDIILQKVPNDTLLGYYYHYKTNENFTNEFGDFCLFFNKTVYSSYKDKVTKTSFSEKPEAFKRIKFGDDIYKPAIHDSHQLCFVTPYKLANVINEAIDNPESKIIQKKDTVIRNEICSKFVLKVHNGGIDPSSRKGNEMDIKSTYELCFHKEELHPVFYRKDVESSFVNTFQYALFTESKVNAGLEPNYFSEENLLIEGWEKKSNSIKEKNSDELIGKTAPNWNLPVLGKNEMFSNKDFLGKYILLEFTATWCGHCIEAAKMMNRLEDRFKENDNLLIISIFSSDIDKEDGIQRFVDKYDLRSIVLHSATEVGKKYFVKGYPNFFIISPKGNVLMNFGGYGKSVESNITSILSEFL